jgi:hypothetical protein
MSVASSATQTGTASDIKMTKANPRAYGAIIPAPNMYVTTRMQTPYQINFNTMNWLGVADAGAINTEGIPGGDISAYGPWYTDNYFFYTPTNDGYIDPWWIRWFNLTALEATNATLDNPINLNTVWNQYSFSEGGSLDVGINYTIPIEIDITVTSTGPKNLKVDWLCNDENTNFLGTYTFISPSGDPLSAGTHTSRLDVEHSPGTEEQYDLINFIAHETGVYKLLILPTASTTQPKRLVLEFISATVKSLALDTDSYGGNADSSPTYMERIEFKFFNEWWSISAEKGDKFLLDISPDYWDDTNDHVVNIWYPCSSGYRMEADPNAGYGRWDVIAPSSGNIYVSCVTQDTWSI